MRTQVVAAIPAFLTFAGAAGASGDMDYCTLWARASLTIDVAKLDGDGRAKMTRNGLRDLYKDQFGRCYTADSNPPLPALESDREFLTRLAGLFQIPDVPLADGKPAGSIPATDRPAATPAAPTPAPAKPTVGKSGFANGSAGWVNWCARNFPKSFDRKSATVIIPPNYRNRVRCPG